MEPKIELSALAIGLATVAFFLVGMLWHTFLFGKSWAKEMGFSKDMTVSKGHFIKSLLLNLLGNFFLVYVLAHNTEAWDATSWGHENNFVEPAQAAIMSASFTWLGFFVPQDLGVVSWQMKSWKLFFINTGYHLVSLLVVSFILVFVQ